MDADVAAAYRRLCPGTGPDIREAVAAVSVVTGETPADPARLLDALLLLRWVQGELAAVEPRLIAAAREAGVSWQALAPALGVASRQAAERRYLRGRPATGDRDARTQDDRVRAERDRRAGHRAVARWANDHTADLRRLAGQISALPDLGESASADVGRLTRALADPDASALPALLARTHRHLGRHPELAEQVDRVTVRTNHVRRTTQRQRDERSP